MKLELHYSVPGEDSSKIGCAYQGESDTAIINAVREFIAPVDSNPEDFVVHWYADRVIVIHSAD